MYYGVHSGIVETTTDLRRDGVSPLVDTSGVNCWWGSTDDLLSGEDGMTTDFSFKLRGYSATVPKKIKVHNVYEMSHSLQMFRQAVSRVSPPPAGGPGCRRWSWGVGVGVRGRGA